MQGVGEEENLYCAPCLFSCARFARKHANVFEKNQKKKNKTSVYRLVKTRLVMLYDGVILHSR